MIQINVTAKCESMTQKGTKCTKDAKVYEPGHSHNVETDTVRAVAKDFHDFIAIPTGFRCNTHSREGRGLATRRWTANHFSRTTPRMHGINTI